MTNTDSENGEGRNVLSWVDWVKFLAVAGIVAVAAIMAWLGVQAWRESVTPEMVQTFIGLAVASEALGLVMAVMGERMFRRGEWLKGCFLTVFLVFFAGFNAWSGHQAYDRFMNQPRFEAAQSSLNQARGQLLDRIAEADAAIQRYDHLVPDRGTVRARQAGLQQSWAEVTASARARQARLQAQLDALPIVAEVPPARPDWQVWLFLGGVELIKALGLWAVGAGGRRERPIQRRSRDLNKTPSAPVETPPSRRAVSPRSNVVPFARQDEAGRASRETVETLASQSLSYRTIARETGVPLSTVGRWLKAKAR